MAVSIEPHIWANDLARSIKWYEELGFEPSQWFPSEQAPTWCQLAYGDASLMIAVVPDRCSSGREPAVPGGSGA